MVYDMIPGQLEDWDNKSSGENVPNTDSAEQCAKAYRDNIRCLQSLWKGDQCLLGTEKIVFGVKHGVEEGGKKWQSTWNKTRIADWVLRQGRCDTVTFPFEDGISSPSSGLRCPGQ